MKSVDRGEFAAAASLSFRGRRARRRRRERVPPGGGRGSVLGRVRILLFGVDVLLAGDVRDGDGFAVDHDAVVEPGETGTGRGDERREEADGRTFGYFLCRFRRRVDGGAPHDHLLVGSGDDLALEGDAAVADEGFGLGALAHAVPARGCGGRA